MVVAKLKVSVQQQLDLQQGTRASAGHGELFPSKVTYIPHRILGPNDFILMQDNPESVLFIFAMLLKEIGGIQANFLLVEALVKLKIYPPPLYI
jgi:hypothetical protein